VQHIDISPGGLLPTPWWRNAVIYQLYVRSFADANGDGVGDLAGVRQRLGYLRDLGVDAIWYSPWYASPLHDGGYDVADYRAIEPAFGTLAEAEALIADALGLGIRTIIDVVPNHVSDQHRWFIEAHAGGPGSPMRQRFWFRPGRGSHGDQPPNNWTSHFGDSAWTRTKNPDGTRGEWFLHLFAPAQPDLNWDHPAVREEHEAILRFWFDRGAAGIRIDSAALAIKDPALPDLIEVEPGSPGSPGLPSSPGSPGSQHPFVDRDEIHDIYRSWRVIADSYDPPRALIGEVWLEDRRRFARYLRPDELHGAFNFDFLACPWDSRALRACIDDTLDSHAPVGAPPSWVLSNHDVTRVVTRYGRADTTFSFAAKRIGTPTDLALGYRRARAAALLVAALPGTLYVYQGEELGLPEVEDLPVEHLQDPMHFQSGGTDPGRDGCRVPLPWADTQAPFGFGPQDSVPWLPQPSSWATLSVAAQQHDETSMLTLYRDVIALRRDRFVGNSEALRWLPAPDGVLAFARVDVGCIVNLSPDPVQLPAGTVLISSGPLDGDRLPVDTAAWVQLAHQQPDPEQ
jgi:alpha-glucosidase